jgi:sulfur carrier protein
VSASDLLEVWLNGATQQVPANTTIAAMVSDLGASATGLAVALNEEVVPRSRWDSTELANHDRIEVLVPTQGG